MTKNGLGRRVFRLRSPENELFDFARALIDNFLDVVRKKSTPMIPAREVLASIELLEEAYNKATRFSMPWYETREAIQSNVR